MTKFNANPKPNPYKILSSILGMWCDKFWCCPCTAKETIFKAFCGEPLKNLITMVSQLCCI